MSYFMKWRWYTIKHSVYLQSGIVSESTIGPRNFLSERLSLYVRISTRRLAYNIGGSIHDTNKHMHAIIQTTRRMLIAPLASIQAGAHAASMPKMILVNQIQLRLQCLAKSFVLCRGCASNLEPAHAGCAG
jgi:hypothetical protein